MIFRRGVLLKETGTETKHVKQSGKVGSAGVMDRIKKTDVFLST